LLYTHLCTNVEEERRSRHAAQPQWLLHLCEILDTLRALPSPVVDRSLIEEIFRVDRRRAIHLLHRFGGFQTGKTFFIDRLQLIGRLEQIRNGDEFQRESLRRARLIENLERTRQLARGEKIRIQAADDVRDRRLADLPPGIHLKPGELRIEFFGTEDLLRHLFELSQAILNDYKKFQEIIEERTA